MYIFFLGKNANKSSVSVTQLETLAMKKLINFKYEGMVKSNLLFPDVYNKKHETYIRITAAKKTARALSGAKLPDVRLLCHTYATAGTDKGNRGCIDWTNDQLD